jgi:hypothetical protein
MIAGGVGREGSDDMIGSVTLATVKFIVTTFLPLQ